MKARLIISSGSPLNFRASRSTASFETFRYIPGTAWLGAFAAAHRKIRDDKAELPGSFSPMLPALEIFIPQTSSRTNFPTPNLRDDDGYPSSRYRTPLVPANASVASALGRMKAIKSGTGSCHRQPCRLGTVYIEWAGKG